MQDFRLRFTIISLIILAACYLLWPTYKFYSLSNEEKSSYQEDDLEELKNNAIKLGLDLQGGMYIVLEADIPTLMIKSANKMSPKLESIINASASSQGAPNIVKGLEVPRPSERLVPSSKHVPEYAIAVLVSGIFGDGGTLIST